jgi:hypothetical protein
MEQRIADLTRQLRETEAEVERLRQYEPPISFQGTEIVWDDTAKARAERDEARALARQWFWDVISEQYGGIDEILEEFPWLAEETK